MSLIVHRLGRRFELSANRAGRMDSGASGFLDAGHAARTLRQMLAYEQNLHRLRQFLFWEMGWRDMWKRNDFMLLAGVGEALHRGSLSMRETAVEIRAAAAAVARDAPVSGPEEEWVESGPEAAPEAEPSEAFAVSYESAVAIAASNRETAAAGSPLKEICRVKDCPVCTGQLAVMAT